MIAFVRRLFGAYVRVAGNYPTPLLWALRPGQRDPFAYQLPNSPAPT